MISSPADWRQDAACREEDSDGKFFRRGDEQRRVKVVCLGCPVRTECLSEALDNRLEYGVWGGMTERERGALLRRRPEIQSWTKLLSEARDRGLDADLADDLDVLAEVEACYRAEFTRLVGFVIKLGYGEQEALDAAQTAFTEALRSWKTIREPRAWLRATCSVIHSIPAPPSAHW